MATTDKALGSAMLFLAMAIFLYYTTWTIVLPFLDEPGPIHRYFPSREWAVRIPAFILVVGLTGIGIFIGKTMLATNKRRAAKKTS